jgi:hypothetical protein
MEYRTEPLKDGTRPIIEIMEEHVANNVEVEKPKGGKKNNGRTKCQTKKCRQERKKQEQERKKNESSTIRETSTTEQTSTTRAPTTTVDPIKLAKVSQK